MARSITFVVIDTFILLLSVDSRRVVVSLKLKSGAKVCTGSTG